MGWGMRLALACRSGRGFAVGGFLLSKFLARESLLCCSCKLYRLGPSSLVVAGLLAVLEDAIACAAVMSPWIAEDAAWTVGEKEVLGGVEGMRGGGGDGRGGGE